MGGGSPPRPGTRWICFGLERPERGLGVPAAQGGPRATCHFSPAASARARGQAPPGTGMPGAYPSVKRTHHPGGGQPSILSEDPNGGVSQGRTEASEGRSGGYLASSGGAWLCRCPVRDDRAGPGPEGIPGPPPAVV